MGVVVIENNLLLLLSPSMYDRWLARFEDLEGMLMFRVARTRFSMDLARML